MVRIYWLALLVTLAAPGCREPEPEPVDTADASSGYPPPRDDLVDPVGGPDTVDIATWNIENFPKRSSTIGFVADVIASLDLDLLAVEEIEDSAAWDELVARLPDHAGVLSSHSYSGGSYQKLGFIYREDLVSVSDVSLLFTSQGYDFPRPPLQITVTVDDGNHPAFDFTAIAVHLKAGFDTSDRNRRTSAIQTLEAYVGDRVGGGETEIVVLGDFNEILTTTDGRQVMAPWLDEPGQYEVETDELATAGAVSFLPRESMLDHVVTTTPLADAAAVVPRIDQQTFNYESAASDHLPVVIRLPIAR